MNPSTPAPNLQAQRRTLAIVVSALAIGAIAIAATSTFEGKEEPLEFRSLSRVSKTHTALHGTMSGNGKRGVIWPLTNEGGGELILSAEERDLLHSEAIA